MFLMIAVASYLNLQVPVVLDNFPSLESCLVYKNTVEERFPAHPILCVNIETIPEGEEMLMPITIEKEKLLNENE